MPQPVQPLTLPAPTYQNPVVRRDFPDPFVLKHAGEYWAYCTGTWEDGRHFGILRSRDLVQWEAVGGAMEPLPGGHTCYWAPEVTYHNGKFYLYYSVGNEEWMTIRVAVATQPAGPFVDSGAALTSQQFAIDAHLFVDDDGQRYLFYATDFLEHTHVGTGTVRDRMVDPFTLAGQPEPVTRACFDWQVYDPNRAERGGVRWHTVEGPFVLKHKGRYYQMFSGGNWQNPSYGVSYASSDTIAPDHEWAQLCDGSNVLPILRTNREQGIVGPGHNSAVRGPDNRQLFCIYHRWSADGAARELGMDPLDWAGERLLLLGPTAALQPVPTPPTFSDFFDGPFGAPWQTTGGVWTNHDGALWQSRAMGTAEARYDVGTPTFLLEVSLRAGAEGGKLGVRLDGAAGTALEVALLPTQGTLHIGWQGPEGMEATHIPLPTDFDPSALHLLRLDVNGHLVSVQLDEAAARWQGWLGSGATAVALFTVEQAAAFAGFAVTVGWEDRFEEAAAPAALGWEGEGAWQLREQQLWHEGSGSAPATLHKGPLLAEYELVVNARALEAKSHRVAYGICPADDAAGKGPLLTLMAHKGGWGLLCYGLTTMETFLLPAAFDPAVFQQFRFRKQAGRLTIHWESHLLGTIELSPQPTRVGLHAQGGAAFDLVRVTRL